jgi:hypothetical protein
MDDLVELVFGTMARSILIGGAGGLSIDRPIAFGGSARRRPASGR